ncbi:MAG: twin-arginine translocase subunit TatC [Crocinitomicaceae bacterium]|nr:twin-arginine translocase subunit TatC [Crocinitomicaceae bacterium]
MEEQEQETRMSFLDHLEELRWRIVKSAIAVVLVAIVVWIFKGWIMQNVFVAMSSPDFVSFKFMCDYFGLCIGDIEIDYQNIELTGQFSYALLMSIMGGFIVAFPFIFYQLWAFVKPGLKLKEKSMAKGIVFYISLLFFVGIAFGYLVVAPLCVQFFGNFQIIEEFENNIRISSFMGTVLSTIFYTGLLFLLPVVIYIMTKLGIMTSGFLRKYRKHSVIAILILSALITPPDFISQVIVGVPILILYEIGILVSSRVEKKNVN